MTEVLSPLISRLKRVEGWRDHLYIDTEGYITGAWGHNFGFLALPEGVKHTDCRIVPVGAPISPELGEALLFDDVAEARRELELRPWFEMLDEVRQDVLTELVFNMGSKVFGFPVFMDQLRRGAFAEAAGNMRGWKWVGQVHHQRADPLIRMMQTGVRE